MIGYLIAFWAGFLFGVIAMACLAVAGRADDASAAMWNEMQDDDERPLVHLGQGPYGWDYYG